MVRGTALIVVEQSTRLLVNYPLLALSGMTQGKIAFWGHGKNMQLARAVSFAERIKRVTIGKVDWWFAYTSLSAEIVASSGYPRSQITNVENATDTFELREHLSACSEREVSAVKARRGIKGNAIGLYCGAMYDLKKLPFLIDACKRIKRAIPEFSAVFVGDGPDKHIVVDAVARDDWMHYVGELFGRELAPFYRMSRALLMPGLVGLAIVDSFVANVPLFTTDLPIHSPEIAYLESGANGIMTAPTVEAFSAAVSSYLMDAEMQKRLIEGCVRSSAHYTIENMVENVTTGIENCLGHGMPQ
jgi:glycosyltransferase involved in cell wall biosynthesis